MTPAVLLLDVDGVLNSFGHAYEERQVWLGARAGAIHPTKLTKPFMKWAWGNFDVLWCTAWFGGANAIADWAGLPHRPHIGDPSDSGDYKLNAVKARFSSHEGKVIWLEDGISKEAEAWVKARSNFLYLYADAQRGVTKWHMNKMAAFAEVPKHG